MDGKRCLQGNDMQDRYRKGAAVESLIVTGILMVIVGTAVLCLRKKKKSGAGCIGCPLCGHCSGRGCGSKNVNKTENGQ